MRKIESVGGLAGCRIATTFPRLTREFLERHGVEAQVIEVTGAVEVTPQLGVADVVDLVASGARCESTGCGRRDAARIQAVLVAGSPDTAADPRVVALTAMLASVVEARGKT